MPMPPSHLVLTLRGRKKPYGEGECRPQKECLHSSPGRHGRHPHFPQGGGRAGRADSGDALTSGPGGPGTGAGPTAATGTQNVSAGRAGPASPTAAGGLAGTRPREPRGPRARSPAAGSPGGCKAPFCALTKMRSRESDVPRDQFKAFGQGAWPEARGVTEKAGLPLRLQSPRAQWAELPC